MRSQGAVWGAAFGWLMACTSPRDTPGAHRPSATPDPVFITPDPNDDLAGLDSLPCARGEACASHGPFLGDTCCTYGDNLVAITTLAWPDATEITLDDEHAVVCTTSGAAFVSTSQFAQEPSPTPFPPDARCQQAELGPSIPGGRIVWLAHAGDNTVPNTPRLQTYVLTDDGSAQLVQEVIDTPAFDLSWSGERLAVATADVGIQLFTLEDDGSLNLDRTVGIDEEVETLAFADSFLYVGTRNATLLTVDLADPEAPLLLSEVTLAGRPRLLRAQGNYLAVALGVTGLQLFDRSLPESPLDLGVIPLSGSVQDVSLDGPVLAVATWHEALLIDPETTSVIASQRYASPHSRTRAVALRDNTLYIADRAGVTQYAFRPGFVTSDLNIAPSSIHFGQHGASRQITLRNRGALNLVLYGVDLPDPAFTTTLTPMVIDAGATLVFALNHTGTASGGTLALTSNDPDAASLPLYVSALPDTVLPDFDSEPAQLLFATDLSSWTQSRIILDLEDLDVAASVVHDGAASSDEFADRLGSDIPVVASADLADRIAFPDYGTGPKLAILDANGRVRALRSHYDPKELTDLVAEVLDD